MSQRTQMAIESVPDPASENVPSGSGDEPQCVGISRVALRPPGLEDEAEAEILDARSLR